MSDEVGNRDPLTRWLLRFAVASGIATLGLGIYSSSPGDVAAFVVGLYRAAGLILLEGLWAEPGEVARPRALLGAMALGLVTALLATSFLVREFLSILRGGRNRLRLRSIRREAERARRRPLVVLCGLGRVGTQLVRDLTSTPGGAARSIVVIERDDSNPSIPQATEQGAVVLVGDATNVAVRRKVPIHLADELFVACGDDATNLDIAARIVEELEHGESDPGRSLLCVVGLASPTLAKAARDNPIFSRKRGRVRFHLFNLPDHAALTLVKGPLGRRHAPLPNEVAHYFVVGFGAVGQAIALQAAELAHFENARRLRMTILDDWDNPQAERTRRSFLERHPAFSPDPQGFDLEAHVRDPDPSKDDWSYRAGRPEHPAWRREGPTTHDGRPVPIEYVVNAEFLHLPAAVESPDLVDRIATRLSPDQRPPVRPAVIVCFDEDHRNLEGALALSGALSLRGLDPPVFVHLAQEEGLAAFLKRGRTGGTLGDVHAFGQTREVAAYHRLTQEHIFQRADALHAAHLEVARRAGGGAEEVTAWLEHAFQGSSEAAAHHVDIKADAVRRMAGLSQPGPDSTVVPPRLPLPLTQEIRGQLARMEHNRYVAERLLEGWRYGARDDRLKLRASLCAWECLSEEEKEKDFGQIDALVELWDRMQRETPNPRA